MVAAWPCAFRAVKPNAHCRSGKIILHSKYRLVTSSFNLTSRMVEVDLLNTMTSSKMGLGVLSAVCELAHPISIVPENKARQSRVLKILDFNFNFSPGASFYQAINALILLTSIIIITP